jgi:hypothetical protein
MLLVLAGTAPAAATAEWSAPGVQALDSLDAEPPGDFPMDLPAMPAGRMPVHALHAVERHACAALVRVATRATAPPDRPPRPA